MTEEEARTFVRSQFGVSRETICAKFAKLVGEENARQNLVSPSTLSHIWVRHIADSAQLALWAPKSAGVWCDIGSGAGFPGMVIAAVTDYNMTMIEPRRKRASFLNAAADALGLSNVKVVQRRAETTKLSIHAEVVSARAVASLPDIFRSASHLATRSTTWILPKGRSAEREIAQARGSWLGKFHVEPSLTSVDAAVVICSGVAPR